MVNEHLPEHLRSALDDLRANAALKPPLLDALADLLVGPEEGLLRVDPIAFAARRRLDEGGAIDLFLHAARAGLFELRWDLICAHCNGIYQSLNGMASMVPHFTCAGCKHDTDVALDNLVHVTFTATPWARPLTSYETPLLNLCALAPEDTFLSARRLLSVQTFRELFPFETVGSNHGFIVRDLTFLFTDLKGSTQLYEQLGDLNAFGLVQQHFLALIAVVRLHRGAVVKTIGDAVMATFPSPADGVRAGLEMITAIETFNAHRASRALAIKLGVHRGPAIAVALNDKMDYFGQSVNMAARIQGLADAQQLYLSDAVALDPTVPPLLDACAVTRAEVQLKGIAAPCVVHRIDPGRA